MQLNQPVCNQLLRDVDDGVRSFHTLAFSSTLAMVWVSLRTVGYGFFK